MFQANNISIIIKNFEHLLMTISPCHSNSLEKRILDFKKFLKQESKKQDTTLAPPSVWSHTPKNHVEAGTPRRHPDKGVENTKTHLKKIIVSVCMGFTIASHGKIVCGNPTKSFGRSRVRAVLYFFDSILRLFAFFRKCKSNNYCIWEKC